MGFVDRPVVPSTLNGCVQPSANDFGTSHETRRRFHGADRRRGGFLVILAAVAATAAAVAIHKGVTKTMGNGGQVRKEDDKAGGSIAAMRR